MGRWPGEFNRFAHPGGPSDPCFFDSLLSCALVFIDFGVKILGKYVQMRFRMGFGGCMGPFASPGGPLGSCLGLLRANIKQHLLVINI